MLMTFPTEENPDYIIIYYLAAGQISSRLYYRLYYIILNKHQYTSILSSITYNFIHPFLTKFKFYSYFPYTEWIIPMTPLLS